MSLIQEALRRQQMESAENSSSAQPTIPTPPSNTPDVPPEPDATASRSKTPMLVVAFLLVMFLIATGLVFVRLPGQPTSSASTEVQTSAEPVSADLPSPAPSSTLPSPTEIAGASAVDVSPAPTDVPAPSPDAPEAAPDVPTVTATPDPAPILAEPEHSPAFLAPATAKPSPPADTVVTPHPAVSWPRLSLTGILAGPGGGAAILNQTVVGIGETIDGVRLVEIAAQRIQVEHHGVTREIRMGQTIGGD